MLKDDAKPEYERVGAGALETVAVPGAPLEEPEVARPGQGGGTFSALRHRNFRLFWIGALVSNLGGWLQVVAQNWLVLSLTNSAFLLGLVNFIGNSPMLLLSLFGGVVADRNSRKTVLLITQNAQAILMLIMAVLSFFNIINIWMVIVIALGIGIVQAFNSPAYQTIMLDLVRKEDIMNAIALNSFQFNLTRVIGPGIAGVLVTLVGVAVCFFLNSLSFMAVVGALLLVKLPKPVRIVEKRPMWEEIKESLSYLKSQVALSGLLMIASLFSFFITPYLTLLPVFVQQVFKSGPEDYGILLSAVGVGALTGALLVANISGKLQRRSRFMNWGMLILVGSLFGFSLSTNLILSMVMLALAGGSLVSVNTTLNTIVQSSVPDYLRGRILSIWTLCSVGFMPLGNLQSGIVAQAWGAPVSVMVNMAFFVLFTILIYWFIPKARRF
ncbi:MAG: MFS transporter [Chloroflexi bacterium]|nr:MFS transporter [Chloroflexota bacterium]